MSITWAAAAVTNEVWLSSCQVNIVHEPVAIAGVVESGALVGQKCHSCFLRKSFGAMANELHKAAFNRIGVGQESA